MLTNYYEQFQIPRKNNKRTTLSLFRIENPKETSILEKPLIKQLFLLVYYHPITILGYLKITQQLQKRKEKKKETWRTVDPPSVRAYIGNDLERRIIFQITVC